MDGERGTGPAGNRKEEASQEGGEAFLPLSHYTQEQVPNKKRQARALHFNPVSRRGCAARKQCVSIPKLASPWTSVQGKKVSKKVKVNSWEFFNTDSRTDGQN